MTPELTGGLDGDGLKIGIVVARFNAPITSRLLDGALTALSDNGVDEKDVTIAHIPGSFELPVVAREMAESEKYDAVICLGAVIKGETDHYRYVAGEAARGIAEVGRETGIPTIFGVLTTDTKAQALERAGGTEGNKGYDAALAAIEMVRLLRQMPGA